MKSESVQCSVSPGVRPIARNRGFALVITLSLMILLTLLAVGLLTLSSVSLRSASQGAEMKVARANARLALMLALGELQREMGPDQRISAPGGQLCEEGPKSGGTHWTGVYDAWPAKEENRPEPKFRRWLISGEEALVTNPEAAKFGTPGAGIIAVVAGDDKTVPVEAGLVRLPNGACAWWVGDQNTKAKLGGAVVPAGDANSAIPALRCSGAASAASVRNRSTNSPKRWSGRCGNGSGSHPRLPEGAHQAPSDGLCQGSGTRRETLLSSHLLSDGRRQVPGLRQFPLAASRPRPHLRLSLPQPTRRSPHLRGGR